MDDSDNSNFIQSEGPAPSKVRRNPLSLLSNILTDLGLTLVSLQRQHGWRRRGGRPHGERWCRSKRSS
jgi:hypothetical protein